jgi:hypothetical protein
MDAVLSFGSNGYELCLAEHFQVLRDRRRRHVELINDFTGGPVAQREHLYDAASRRIGKGGEGLHGIDDKPRS